MVDHLSRVVVRSRETVSRMVDGQSIIVHPRTEEVIVLNTTGSVVWQLTDGSRTAGEVAAALSSDFDVPLATAQADVVELYEQLLTAGVATVSE